MPTLQKRTEEVKQFFLPSTAHLPQEQQAWVKLDVGHKTAADMMEMGSDDVGREARAGAKALIGRMREWNYTEDDGTLVPINFDSVCRMEVDDYSYLMEQLNEHVPAPQGVPTDQKKS